MKKLNENKDYGIIVSDSHGRKFEQDGCYFDALGNEMPDPDGDRFNSVVDEDGNPLDVDEDTIEPRKPVAKKPAAPAKKAPAKKAVKKPVKKADPVDPQLASQLES